MQSKKDKCINAVSDGQGGIRECGKDAMQGFLVCAECAPAILAIGQDLPVTTQPSQSTNDKEDKTHHD